MKARRPPTHRQRLLPRGSSGLSFARANWKTPVQVQHASITQYKTKQWPECVVASSDFNEGPHIWTPPVTVCWNVLIYAYLMCVCVCVPSSCAGPSSWALDCGSCWTIRASSWSSVSACIRFNVCVWLWVCFPDDRHAVWSLLTFTSSDLILFTCTFLRDEL